MSENRRQGNNKKSKVIIGIFLCVLVIGVGIVAGIYVFKKKESPKVNPVNLPNAYEDTSENNILKPIVTYNETILFLDDNKSDEKLFKEQDPKVVLNDAKIKERYNKQYNVYLDGKKLTKVEGKIARNNGGTYIILIDWESNDILKKYDRYELLGRFVYVSEEYNAIPRSYEYYNKEQVSSKIDKELKSSIIGYMKAKNIVVSDEKFSMYEMYVVDIDGDGKKEKIVNMNNYIGLEDPQESEEAIYYSYIAVLSDSNKLIKEINTESHSNVIGINPDYIAIRDKLYKTIPMLVDVNNDNKLDIYVSNTYGNTEVNVQ